MMMPMTVTPRILALDTASVRGSIALLEGNELRAEVRSHSLKTHSTLLLRAVDFLLDRTGWKLKDLNLVAAGIGPGSFTGIRIGIATALGICQSLDLPFSGISGLDALAHEATWLEGDIGVLMDAHRNQYYCAEYRNKNGKLRQLRKPALIDISDLERCLEDRHLYMVGDLTASQWKEVQQSSEGWPRAVRVDLFLSAGIGRLALSRKRQWRSGDSLAAEPLYIRPPDALRNKSRKR
jgi:tRNA threonylcarbamoyladenosine biosynthesis protein TsaB